jgi:acetyl-CoA synthetase
MWFKGYVDAPEKTAERFSGDRRWCFTGDAGLRDERGFYYFSSRDDDVIIMSGYRIGPFEVESVLVLDHRVAEAAVVGLPDELTGQSLQAFVVLKPGVNSSDELAQDLQQLVKRKFAAHAYPRAVHFVSELPKTPSGKVQRYVLRERHGKGGTFAAERTSAP